MGSIGFDGFSKKIIEWGAPPPTLWETLHISYYLMQAMEGDFLKFKE